MEEKKESWIAKLIELLNEYHHFNSDLIYYWWDEEYERVYFHTELPEEQKEKLAKAGIDDEWIDEQQVYDEWICSKKFWFIKWLVENDKISNDWIKPRTDLVKEITIVDYKTGDAIWWENKYTEVEQLIMYLSIQDEPIRFLCEIIK